MKRDFDLIRTLLHVIENVGNPSQALVNTHGLSVNDPRVQYHLRLLVDAGYVRGYCQTSDGHVCVRLTWEGHELLELTRNDAVWARAKKLVEQQTHGMSISSLHAVLTRWAQEVVTATDNWLPEARPANGHRIDAAPSATSRRFVPPPTVHPQRSYWDRRFENVTHGPPEAEVHSMAESNGNGSSHGTLNGAERYESGEPDSADSTFQFHVWSGHIETLPIYLL